MIALRSIAQLVTPHRPSAVVRCDLCTTPIGDAHRHVVELGVRGMLCACPACAILFAHGDRYRTVPERVLVEPELRVTPERLGLPVGLAFCVRDSRGRVTACYPGPAGIVDAELDPAAWDALAAATPLASALEPEVEALIVRGERGAPRVACYLAPISAAYELVARLRTTWRGFSGGDEAARELSAFFAELERRGLR
jgi:hypothetical protein